MASSKSFLDYKNTQRKKEKKDEKIIGKYFSSVESERPNPSTINTTKSQTEEQSGSSAKSFLDWKVNERKNEVKQNGYERNGVYAFKPSPYTKAADSRATLMDLASQKVAFDRREAARRHQTNGGTMRGAQPTIPEQVLPGSPYIGTTRTAQGQKALPSIEQLANPMRYADTRRQTAGGNSTVESSTVDRMLQAAKQSEARAAEEKEQIYQRNAVNALGNPNARAGGNWHTTPTGAWGAQDQTGRFVSPQSQRYEQDYRDTDPMRRLAAESVSAQDAENPLNTRGNTKPYSVMTDDEKSVYNYLYSTYGPARAEEYHNGLMDEINRRIGQENYEANTKDLNTAQKTLRSYQRGLSSGIEGILNAPAALMGAENRRARSAAEYENSALRSDQENNTAQKILYDIASSTGNMTPGIVASTLGAPAFVGSTLFATSAGGNAYAEAMNAGEDVSTSRAYAVQQFADEEATNWLLGGINAFGGGAVRKVMQNSAAGRTLDAAVNRLVKTESGRRMLHMMMDYVGDMAGEAQQEYVQFYTENFTKAILGMKDENGNPIDFNFNPADPDALYAALLGALNAGALNAAPAAARVIHGSGTDVQNAGGLAEDLRNTTREDYTSDAAYESAMRLEAVAREIGDRQAAGRSPSAMDRIAFNEAMSEFIEASTEAEAESEEEDPRASFVDESGLTLQEITEGARQLREAENRTDAPGAESSEAEPSRMSIPAEMKEQAAYDLLETRRPERIQWTDGTGTFVMQREADESYSVTNQRGETSGLTEDQAAQMLPADTELTITWGEQRQAEQVRPTVTPESLPSYEASAPVAGINARTENINTGVDNRLMALAQDVTQERTQQKAAQMQSVYDAGKNMQAENLRSVMNGATMLTEQEKQTALRRGMQEAVAAARTQTAQATNAAVQKIRIPGVKEGKVSYDPKVDQSKLTEGQKVNGALAGAFASKVFGANVVLTQSNVVNGRYEGANGWFRFGGADDQTFYFDVNAGKNRVSDWKNSPFDAKSVMPVIAHEGTHWMEKNHPEAYKGLESQVLDALSKDKAYTRNGELSLDDIISLEQKRMDREEPHADGRPHTVEEAKAELVARGCEDMLNGNEYAKAAFSDLDIEAKKTLWDHIRGVFESIQRFFDELLKNYRSDSQEARAIRRNKEAYAELLNTYGEILGMGREIETGGEINREEAADLRNAGIVLNDAGTVASMQYSSRYSWKTQEEVDKAVAALQKSLGVSKKKAQAFVESERSLTNLILSPGNVAAMDFIADDRYSAIKKNSDYPQGTVDFNNNCRKRVPFTTLFDRIQERNPNRLFTAEDLEIIRQNMIKNNYQVACGLCFVEERRQRLGEIADSFVQLYKNGAVLDQFVGKTPFEKMKAALDSVEGDDYTPTIADLITYKGLKKLEAEHKGIADAFRIFNNARGMQSGRLVEGRAEYKRELLTYKPSQVKRVNDLGGLRIFSYSDFEAVNLLDLVQIVQDASTKGIMIQAYTKVPAFAKVVRNTGIKLNRSLIAAGTGVKYVNGHMELDLDPVEGININDPDFFDSTDDRDVGNILVGMSDEQIRLAMNSPFVDYIIPFHTSLPKTILEAKKIDHWKNYKLSQTDKDMNTGKNAKNINIYTDVLQAAEAEGKPIKNKVDFVNKFLQVAKERNLIPRFSEFLNVDKDGNYVYTEGYHKFLIDFKLFDKNGRIVEQRPVRPVFDDAFNTKLMEDFAKGVGSVAISEELYRDTVDALNEKSSGETVQYSTRLQGMQNAGDEGIRYSSSLNPYDGSKDVSQYFRSKGNGWEFYDLHDGTFELVEPSGKSGDYNSAEDAIAYYTEETGDAGLREYVDKMREFHNRMRSNTPKPVDTTKDNRGHLIPKAMREYMKNSKMRDSSGRLKTMFHGTDTANFTVFDPTNSKDNISLFFTDSPAVADSYHYGEASSMMWWGNDIDPEALQREINWVTDGEWEASDDGLILTDPDGEEHEFDTPAAARDYFIENADEIAGVYEVYLNLENPLELDAKGAQWNNLPSELNGKKIGTTTREWSEYAHDNGYDGVIFRNIADIGEYGSDQNMESTVAIAFSPNQVKSIYNENPTENEDIRYSMRDSSGQELTEAQAEYFKDSKVRDAEGNLLRVYHGTNAEFYEFDRDRIGAHGSYEGAGFNFTPSSTRAGGYKGIGGGEGRVMEGYLNITNPLSAEKKTMTVRQLAKLIEKIDPTGDDLISNYAQDTRDYGKPSFVKREALYTARQMMNYHDSDADIYADLSASGASTSAIIDAFKTLGYDGLIHYDSEGKINTLIAFDSNQFKNIDNKAPTESADIRHSSRNASSDLNLLKAERLSEKYVKELEDTIAERDTQIAELQEQMEKAVGAEKEKRKQQLAKLRKEKNDRIAYLEKSYRVNLNWQIAEMRQKMDRAIGEEKAQAKERLDALRAQKNQKIEEILQKNREQREQRRFNRSAQELIKRARRLKKMKGSQTFRAQVDALIGDLDLISPGMKDNTRQRLQKLKEEVDAQAALDPDYAKYEAVKYDKFLNRLKKKQIKDMPLEDIISIAEALAALEHSKKTADREIKEGQGKLFADYGRTAVAQLKKTKGINYGNEIGSMLGKYRLNMLNPTRAFQLLDGYQKDGVFTYFAKELNDGQTRAAEFRQKAEAMFQEIDNNPNLVNDFAKQNIEIMTVEGMKKISKGMRISLYLHAKSLDNVKHISYGGITIPNESLYRRGKYSEAYTAGETVHLIPQDTKNPDMMAAKAIRAITDKMTPEEKQYADIAYKFLNETTKEAINEVSLALDGYEKATVEDYFPIRSDPNFTQASMEGLQKDGTIEGMGMLKERTGSGNPILLEDASQVVLRQKNNTAMYYGLAIPIRNFNRFYNYTGTGFARSVKQSVGKTWGAAGQKYIDNVISDLQFGRQTQRTVLDSMKGLYAGTTLNLNLGVSIKQSASYPFAASVIGWAPLAKALGQRFTAADRAYMDSITPWGYMRRTGFSGTEMGEVARQRTGIDNNQTIQKAKTMLDFIRRVDVATTEKLFKACENYVQEKYPDLEVRGEKYGKKLAEIYNETLQRTQPSYDVMQRNEFLRSQNDLTKVLGAFKTQTFNMGGEILDAYGKWRAHSEYAKIDPSYETMAKESGKAFRTTVAATIVAQAMLVALSAAANAVLHKMKPYRDDKGEVTAESLAKKVMQDFATSFAGLTMGGSEAQAAVMAVFGGEKWYDIEYPGLSMINELVSSITDFSTAVRKSLDKDNAKAAEDRQKASVRLGKVLMQVFKLRGIPSQNLYNIANMVYLHGQDLANDELGSFTAGKGLFGLTDTSPTGKQFAKQAFYYYGKGDVSKGTKAAKRASESGIKDELGGKQENAIEYMKKSNLDEKTMKMLWELAGWKANTYDKKMAK